jgi:hypothetical protein
MENENHPANRQENAFHFQMPLAPYSSFITETQKKPDTDTNNLKQSNWYNNALKQIEESEYEIKPVDNSKEFASPNRQQNLRAFYSANTFTLEPRTDDEWKLQLTMKGLYSGKNKICSLQDDAIIITEKNKIQFNHNNEFTVEYINSKEGVRQNFIIEKEPAPGTRALSVKLEANKVGSLTRFIPGRSILQKQMEIRLKINLFTMT